MKVNNYGELIGTRWQRKEQNESYPYNGYTVLMVTNLLHEHPAHPPQVVYKGDNQKCWSLDLSKWPGNLEPETEDNFKKVPIIIDLDESAWSQIKDSVAKSKWIPEEYCMNDWLADICYFLEHGTKPMIDDCTVECIYEIGCSAMQTGHCALSHCPKFIKRH